ncbi:MAG: hypothetical protein ABH880_03215 [Patescibacteria group bacterium]
MDFENFDLVRTGGIYLSSNPSQASISLNGEFQNNKSGILQKGTLITNLVPGEYRVELREEGRFGWIKNLDVVSGEVSVFDTIVLLKNPDPQILKEGLFTNFDAKGPHLALEVNGSVQLDGTQVLGHRIISLTESGTIITKSDQTSNYYLASVFNPEEGLNLSLIFNNLKESRLGLPGVLQLKRVLPIPNKDKLFVVSTDKAIYLLDIDRPNIELLTSSYDYFDLQDNGTLVWVDGSTLHSFNFLLRNDSEVLDLGDKGLVVKKIARINEGWLILEGGVLSIRSGENIIPLGNATDFTISPSGDKIAVLDGGRNLYVYNPKTKLTFSGLGQAVENIVWYEDEAHIFVLEGGALYFRDITKGLPVNSFELDKGVSKLVYRRGENKVFISKESGIWEIQL